MYTFQYLLIILNGEAIRPVFKGDNKPNQTHLYTDELAFCCCTRIFGE